MPAKAWKAIFSSSNKRHSWKKKELNELDMMEIVEVRVKLPERRAQALELPVKRG